jgi:hypothetical protein
MYLKANLHEELVQIIEGRILPGLYALLPTEFIDQMKPEARLGCHPFHITLVGRVHECFPNPVVQIAQFLSNYSCEGVTITPTNRISISPGGRVLWHITQSNLEEVSDDIVQRLLCKSKIVNQYRDYHITLGIVTNPNYFRQSIYIDEATFHLANKSFPISGFSWDY